MMATYLQQSLIVKDRRHAELARVGSRSCRGSRKFHAVAVATWRLSSPSGRRARRSVETQSHGLFTPIIPLGEIGKGSLRLDDDADAAKQPQSPSPSSAKQSAAAEAAAG
jgi:hypothetical protein